MAKDPKKPSDDKEPEFIPFQEEGALEIPDPADENEATISMNFEDMEEKVDAPDMPPEENEFEEIQPLTESNEGEASPSSEVSEDELVDDLLQDETPSEPQPKRTMLAKGGELESFLGEEESSEENSPKRTMLAPAGLEDMDHSEETEKTDPETPLDGLHDEEQPTTVQEPITSKDDIDNLIDDVPPAAMEDEASPEAAEEEVVDETKDVLPAPRKRGFSFVAFLVGLLFGGSAFCLNFFGIEIPHEMRMNKGNDVIALENGKKKAESDAKSKGETISKLEGDLKKQEEDFGIKEKAALKKSKDDLDVAQKKAEDELKLAQKKAEDDLKGAQKKYDDEKAALEKAAKDAQVVADKKLMDEMKASEKALAEEKKMTADKLKAEGDKFAALKAEKTKTDADLTKVREFQAGIAKELAKANLATEKSDPNAISGGLQEALKIVQSKDPQGMMRDTKKQLESVKDQLAKSRQPAEMLNYWRNLVDAKTHPEMESKASEDVLKVLADASSVASQKTQASVLQGIILRNQGKYAEAKTALEKLLPAIDSADTAWKKSAEAALAESKDPVGFYLDLSKKQESMNLFDEAVGSLGKAIKLCDAFAPTRKAELLANSSLMKMERAMAKAGSNLKKDDQLLKDAANEAAEAAKSKTALAFYAQGRVAEVRGDIIPAIEAFRKAVDANPKLDAAGVKYRAALMRMLNGSLPNVSKPAPKVEPKKEVSSLLFEELVGFTTALYFQLPEPIVDAPKISAKEAQDLADAILKSQDASFVEKAQAYGTKGYWTKALKTYVDGIREKIGPVHAENLNNLLKNHPGLEGAAEPVQNNFLEAERFFSSGLTLYFNKNFAAAEKAFLAAVENERQDARYHYYLGLARLAQQKPEAVESFEYASMKERQGKPSRAAVSKSLERVQGPARLELNRYRNAPQH
ncbi:MAG: hypothetical protein ACO3GX_10920 [Gemmataceae bacterium]